MKQSLMQQIMQKDHHKIHNQQNKMGKPNDFMICGGVWLNDQPNLVCRHLIVTAKEASSCCYLPTCRYLEQL